MRSIRKTVSAEAIWKMAGYVMWFGKRLALHSESKPMNWEVRRIFNFSISFSLSIHSSFIFFGIWIGT
jgi:hypothetical protein